ncbi:hypothetical protein SERLADRAFT_401389 [Serpula lacrymans var. lacrymans S7.9]|nr:uncharacterized protein SERLADRAFT_401389 [Serpula lacrymans var. lacrymans S7.9]EGO19977.1 hypothetical protein SERLADRAFT_401389 [Serpula lacrymans var. lacrymans S7.9]
MARDSDVAAREPGLSRSVSPEKASKSSSRSVSPSSRPVQIRHKSSSVYESKSKDQIATRQILGHGNDDQSNNERWKAKLYDILDSPATSSSLHSNMSSRSDQFIEPLPTHLISRPSSSNSRSHTPPKLPLAAQHSSSSLSVHMDASTHRPPSVSHASKAAWQLENEKRERERERERERLRQAPSNPSSLKDTTMVYSSTGEYRQRHGSGKGNVAKAHGV